MAVALKRRHPYDVPLLHGRPETVARDSILMGTALSAPVYMLAAQGVAIDRLGRGVQTSSDVVLGGLGTAMVAGYLGEALVRTRLHPSGYDRLETPLIAVALVLSGAMAVLGLGPRNRS
jgi:hypothetical protein